MCINTLVSERASEKAGSNNDTMKNYTYLSMTKTQRNKKSQFMLHVEAGSFTDSEIIMLLGENGTGKTTFVRMLAGRMNNETNAIKYLL